MEIGFSTSPARVYLVHIAATSRSRRPNLILEHCSTSPTDISSVRKWVGGWCQWSAERKALFLFYLLFVDFPLRASIRLAGCCELVDERRFHAAAAVVVIVPVRFFPPRKLLCYKAQAPSTMERLKDNLDFILTIIFKNARLVAEAKVKWMYPASWKRSTTTTTSTMKASPLWAQSTPKTVSQCWVGKYEGGMKLPAAAAPFPGLWSVRVPIKERLTTTQTLWFFLEGRNFPTTIIGFESQKEKCSPGVGSCCLHFSRKIKTLSGWSKRTKHGASAPHASQWGS